MNKQKNIFYAIKKEIEYRDFCSQAFRKCSYGNRNIHKKFRIIQNHECAARMQGLLSTTLGILPKMLDARKQGYIPVVDLCNGSRPQPMLQEEAGWKKENPWEYYFTQPQKEISLEEVYQSKYVEKQIIRYNSKYCIGDRPIPDDEFQILSLAFQQNIHLQEKIKKRVIQEKRKLCLKNNKVLGVGIRAGYRHGMLMNYALFNQHPVVESCAECIKNIEKRLLKWNYDSFFLVVDDRAYLEEIKKYFGKSCIYYDRERFHYFLDALNETSNLDKLDIGRELKNVPIRTRNEEHLIELYLLSQCDSLYASLASGNNFAYLANGGKYSHVEFNDLGEFHYKGKR